MPLNQAQLLALIADKIPSLGAAANSPIEAVNHREVLTEIVDAVFSGAAASGSPIFLDSAAASGSDDTQSIHRDGHVAIGGNIDLAMLSIKGDGVSDLISIVDETDAAIFTIQEDGSFVFGSTTLDLVALNTQVSAMQILTGMPDGSTDLGTMAAGTTLLDNQTLKQHLDFIDILLSGFSSSLSTLNTNVSTNATGISTLNARTIAGATGGGIETTAHPLSANVLLGLDLSNLIANTSVLATDLLIKETTTGVPQKITTLDFWKTGPAIITGSTALNYADKIMKINAGDSLAELLDIADALKVSAAVYEGDGTAMANINDNTVVPHVGWKPPLYDTTDGYVTMDSIANAGGIRVSDAAQADGLVGGYQFFIYQFDGVSSANNVRVFCGVNTAGSLPATGHTSMSKTGHRHNVVGGVGSNPHQHSYVGTLKVSPETLNFQRGDAGGTYVKNGGGWWAVFILKMT